jgi:hypothetical protein
MTGSAEALSKDGCRVLACASQNLVKDGASRDAAGEVVAVDKLWEC